jgi:YgiT-type zinc finger domain-containing protein
LTGATPDRIYACRNAKAMMPNEASVTPVFPCPKCGRPTYATKVKTAIWREDSFCVVEDIPAQVCDLCAEQFYDEDTTDALRRLIEEGSAEPTREILVPFYSLEGRIQRRAALPKGVYADY